MMCPSCATSNPPIARFCRLCGTRVEWPPRRPARSKPGLVPEWLKILYCVAWWVLAILVIGGLLLG